VRLQQQVTNTSSLYFPLINYTLRFRTVLYNVPYCAVFHQQRYITVITHFNLAMAAQRDKIVSLVVIVFLLSQTNALDAITFA